MAERSDVIFDSGLTLFGEVIDRVAPQDWDHPSACEGWTALDVLGHLGSSIDMGISVLEGRQPTWPDVSRPAENVEGEPAEYWQAISSLSRPSTCTSMHGTSAIPSASTSRFPST